MATIEEPPSAKARLIPSNGPLNNLSEILIGKILSHMTCARDVVMASATCIKWRTAARKYLHKVIFAESDFPSWKRSMVAVGWHELCITEALFRISSLQEVSICLPSFEFSAAVVVAWLSLLKTALKSLTLIINITPSINVLEMLGGDTHSTLEHIELDRVYIKRFNPSTHFSSLLSLTLKGPDTVVDGGVEAILSACPKLEYLHLSALDICVKKENLVQARIVLRSFSLKMLEIYGGLGEDIKCIVLLTSKLESLLLSEGDFELVELVQEDGCRTMQHLALKNAHISELRLGASASLLYGLDLIAEEVSYGGCGFYQIFKEVKNLQKLVLVGHFDSSDGGDWLELVRSCPHLHWLALPYGLASRAFEIGSSAEYLILHKLVKLELSCSTVDEDFARCIAQFLKRCPMVKQLTVTGSAPRATKGCPAQNFNRFCSTLVEIMRPYPHVDFKVNLS